MTNKQLAQYSFALFVSIFIMFFIIVLTIGRIQYNNSIRASQNLTDRTDADIENCLRVFYFDIDYNQKPNGLDYLKSGWQTLNNSDLDQ